ncbi:MAG: M67 family metallopeptidase [Chloroflexi bacterium]|nr:M67 family metallopeptidase [Chloroflexota bacterium]
MFYLEKRFYDEIIAHSREDNPNECCGLLMGADGKVLELRRMTNSLHSPMRYNVEPKELLQAHRDMDEKGWDIIGIYHSHTHTQAYPSATDIQLAFWPDALYFIVSLEDSRQPRLRAFRIKDGQVTEETINVVKPWK